MAVFPSARVANQMSATRSLNTVPSWQPPKVFHGFICIWESQIETTLYYFERSVPLMNAFKKIRIFVLSSKINLENNHLGRKILSS